MRFYLPGSSSLGKVHGEDLDRADGQGCFPAQCSHCFLFLLDTYRLQRGCQRPDWECTGCREHQAGQEVLDCLHAGHRCLDFLVSDLPEQSVHGEPKFPVLWRLLFSLCCFSAILPPELFAVTFCVLLLSCKDLVGYIFTTDRWVLRFSWNVKSVVKIWAGAFMLSLLGMLRLRGFLSHLQRQKLTDVTQEQLIGHRNYNLECQYNGHWWRYMSIWWSRYSCILEKEIPFWYHCLYFQWIFFFVPMTRTILVSQNPPEYLVYSICIIYLSDQMSCLWKPHHQIDYWRRNFIQGESPLLCRFCLFG